AHRQRVGDRVAARQVLLDELAQDTRREGARGVVDGHHAARVQPLAGLGQHLVLAHGQLQAAPGAHGGPQLQQLTRQERAREEPLVEPDRRPGARVVAHGRLDDAEVAPARRADVDGDELDAHRGLRTDDHVSEGGHALRVVAPGPRRRLEEVARGVDAALRERGRDRLGTHLDPGGQAVDIRRRPRLRPLARGHRERHSGAGYECRRPRERATATASSSASTIVMASRLNTTAPTTALSGASASMNAPTAPSRTQRPDGKITVMTATMAPTALAPPRYGIAAMPGCAPTEASNAVSAAPPTSQVTQ